MPNYLTLYTDLNLLLQRYDYVPPSDLTGAYENIMENCGLGQPRREMTEDFRFSVSAGTPGNICSIAGADEKPSATMITPGSKMDNDALIRRPQKLQKTQKRKESHHNEIHKRLMARKVACIPCQKAKVRCDILHGAPCSRCERTRRECISHPHSPR